MTKVNDLHRKWLKEPAYRKAHKALAPEFELARAVNLPQVVDACALLGLETGAHEVRDGNGRQQADDGHHDHDFHQRKTAGTGQFYLHMLHSFVAAA